MPANSGAETLARKWSPPPVRSITSAEAPGIAVSMRCLSSSVVGTPLRVASAILSEAMITFTDRGAEKVQDFLASQGAQIQTAGLRVGVRGGGCSGFQYALAFDTQREGDQVFEDHGLRILVDGPSLPYVRGAVVDYVEGLQGAGFKVDNPNVIAACGCGSSFRVADEEEVSAV
jgi:iron-sulfur cluster assembly protein